MNESPGSPAPGGATLPTVVVGFCWLGTATSLLYLVSAYGQNLPFYDEFGLIPYVTGESTLTPGFLWSQHGEHRIFLPRFVYVVVARAAGGNLQAVQYLDALLLSLLSLGAIAAARRLRGRTAYADALLALVCLGTTHAGDVLWGFEIQLVLSTALAGVVLVAAATCGERLRIGTSVAVGLATALLPLCGGNGLLLVPAFAIWLLWRAWHAWGTEDDGQRLAALIAAGLAVVAAGVCALYLVGYIAPSGQRGPPSLTAFALTTAQLLTLGSGLGARDLWPASGVTVVGLLGLAAILGFVRRPSAAAPSLTGPGLLLVALAFVILAIGIAWGRAGLSYDAGWDPRYVTLMMPLLIAVHLIFVTCEPRAASRMGQFALFGLILLTVPANVREGRRHAEAWSQMYARFRQDVAAGMPARLLALRHHGPPMAGLYPTQEVLEQMILALQRAGLCGLERVAPGYGDRRIDEIPFPGLLLSAAEATWEDGRGACLGFHPSLVFRLPAPRHVYAIRFNAAIHDRADGTLSARLRAFWTLGDRPFSEERAITRDVPPFSPSVLIWIDGVIDRLRIDPDIGPCRFEFTDMKMVVPGDSSVRLSDGSASSSSSDASRPP